jgi:hypothetical protein
MRVSLLARWLAGLAAAIAASVAGAVPFAVELTIPDAHGWLASNIVGAPATNFTAPHIVIRVTGDTSNVVYRYGSGTARYQASTVVIEIPGVGKGPVSGSDVTVTAGSTTLSISSPAYPTTFSHGASATYPEIAGYNLQHSLGPIAVDDAHTYHWGPTSGMIPFTLEADGRSVGVSAGRVSGGTLRITVGGVAPNPIAAKTYTDLVGFLQATGPNRVATFEDWANGSSGGVAFPGDLLKVVETVSVIEFPNFVDKPHAYWFGTIGTPKRFALNAGGSDTIATTRFEAIFPEDVQAAGFVFSCYECKTTPLQYGIAWTSRNAEENVVEQGTTVVDLAMPAGAAQPSPGFFGLTSTRAFRRLTIEKHSPFQDAQPWMIDDVRYATTLPSVEYHHAAFGHYFVTSIADEVAKLDDGTFAGWTRTGLRFNANAPGAAGTTPTCRFFSTAFGAKSSHFYTSDSAECALVKSNPKWQFEGVVFGLALPDADGNCGAGSLPLYRLYNNGQGGAPNHRYTTNFAARQASLAAGWIPEGTGPLGVVACVPP